MGFSRWHLTDAFQILLSYESRRSQMTPDANAIPRVMSVAIRSPLLFRYKPRQSPMKSGSFKSIWWCLNKPYLLMSILGDLTHHTIEPMDVRHPQAISNTL